MSGDDVLKNIERLKAEGSPFAVATIVRTRDATSAKASAKAVVTPDEQIYGWIGGGCVQGAVRRAALQSLQDGEARLISVKPEAALTAEGLAPGDSVEGIEYYRSMCPSGGTVDIFVEPSLPRPVLLVCGGSPVARAIAELAPHFGFSVAVAAPAEDRARFAEAGRYMEGYDLSGEPNLDRAYIVVATQGKRDREALAAALKTDAPYISFIGSKAKAAKLREQLAKDGVPASAIERFKCPAGLNIGAITPKEIALSVLAEVVAKRRQRARAGNPAPERRKSARWKPQVVD